MRKTIAQLSKDKGYKNALELWKALFVAGHPLAYNTVISHFNRVREPNDTIKAVYAKFFKYKGGEINFAPEVKKNS